MEGSRPHRTYKPPILCERIKCCNSRIRAGPPEPETEEMRKQLVSIELGRQTKNKHRKPYCQTDNIQAFLETAEKEGNNLFGPSIKRLTLVTKEEMQIEEQAPREMRGLEELDFVEIELPDSD